MRIHRIRSMPFLAAINGLQIFALLDTTIELNFQIIKEQLDVSDSVLSKNVRVLEDANYIQLIKK